MLEVFKTWLDNDEGLETAGNTIDMLNKINSLDDLCRAEFSYLFCDGRDSLVMIHSMKHKEGNTLYGVTGTKIPQIPLELEINDNIFKTEDNLPKAFIWTDNDKSTTKSKHNKKAAEPEDSNDDDDSSSDEDNDDVVIVPAISNKEKKSQKAKSEHETKQQSTTSMKSFLLIPPAFMFFLLHIKQPMKNSAVIIEVYEMDAELTKHFGKHQTLHKPLRKVIFKLANFSSCCGTDSLSRTNLFPVLNEDKISTYQYFMNPNGIKTDQIGNPEDSNGQTLPPIAKYTPTPPDGVGKQVKFGPLQIFGGTIPAGGQTPIDTSQKGATQMIRQNQLEMQRHAL
jgi:hypothetical protein